MEASVVRIRSQSKLRRFWASLDRGQRRAVVSMAAVIGVLHAVGFGILFLVVEPSAGPVRK